MGARSVIQSQLLAMTANGATLPVPCGAAKGPSPTDLPGFGLVRWQSVGFRNFYQDDGCVRTRKVRSTRSASAARRSASAGPRLQARRDRPSVAEDDSPCSQGDLSALKTYDERRLQAQRVCRLGPVVNYCRGTRNASPVRNDKQ